MIFLPYPDCFIVIQNSQSLPGPGTVWTTHCDTTTLCHLPVPIAPDSYVILHNSGNKFKLLFFILNPLSFSPKGEMFSYPFPRGGRLGRGYRIIRIRFEIVK